MSGLYIHIPFCNSKCSYCGFYSETEKELTSEYLNALLIDIKSREKKSYETLYIGGGTPSSLPYGLLADFLDKLFDLVDNDFKESTIEANPESINEDFLSVTEAYAFSRISLGCQSTDDKVLKHLTRLHSSSDINKAVDSVRRICPDTAINLDMIYDIPDTENSSAIKTADDFIALQPEHISAYTYSFDTGFLAGREERETIYLDIKERLEKAGYSKYEISNFAKEGHESIHNINYWNLGDYDGAGSSAWSLKNLQDKRMLMGKISDIIGYIKSPEGFCEAEETVGKELFKENLIFGLRMLSGVDVKAIANRYGIENRLYTHQIEELISEGLLIWNLEKLKLTSKGELFLDSVQEFLWEHLSLTPDVQETV